MTLRETPAPAMAVATETPTATGTVPAVRHRVIFAVAIMLAVFVYVVAYGHANPDRVSDFDQSLAAARALWHDQNPYEVIGPRRAFDWPWVYYYPLTAAVLVAPLAMLPVVVARGVFCALSAGLVAWGITRTGWERWPIFLSLPFFISMELAQWSILITAAVLLPGLSWVGVAKPNLGLIPLAAATAPRVWKPLAMIGTALVVVSIAVRPDWIGDWIATVRSAEHFRAPVTIPFGFLLLLAGLRWRRPEGRLLLALACLPLTPGVYDTLLVFLVPRTFRESLMLVLLSLMVFFGLLAREPWSSSAEWMRDVSYLNLWLLYLPALVMVLRRPNEGTLPVRWRWLVPSERVAA